MNIKLRANEYFNKFFLCYSQMMLSFFQETHKKKKNIIIFKTLCDATRQKENLCNIEFLIKFESHYKRIRRNCFLT